MRKQAFKIAVIAIGISAAFAEKAWSHRFANAWYKISTNPNACTGATLPSGCTPLATSGVICSFADSGGGTKTFFRDGSCVTPYYRQE